MILDDIRLGDRKIKVIYDCGNGTTSIIADKIFNKLNIEKKEYIIYQMAIFQITNQIQPFQKI